MTLDRSGRFFLGGGECSKEGIFLLEKHHEFWNSKFYLLPTNAIIHNHTNLALVPEAKKVLALGNSAGPQEDINPVRADLLRFDTHSHEFRPFLPGITARNVDFSIDGRMIAYIRPSDQTLWISHTDGTAARQIEISADYLELPRWSPDGRSLVFMAELPNKPWRIFVVSADRGSPPSGIHGNRQSTGAYLVTRRQMAGV